MGMWVIVILVHSVLSHSVEPVNKSLIRTNVWIVFIVTIVVFNFVETELRVTSSLHMKITYKPPK